MYNELLNSTHFLVNYKVNTTLFQTVNETYESWNLKALEKAKESFKIKVFQDINGI